MREGDICLLKMMPRGSWKLQYLFAYIVCCENDDNDNWTISRVRVIGEKEDRDVEADRDIVSYTRICQEDKQAAAQKLAKDQWGQVKVYNSQDEVRAVILEIVP